MRQVFELRGEYDVHEDKREDKRPFEFAQRAIKLSATAKYVRLESDRKSDFVGRGL